MRKLILSMIMASLAMVSAEEAKPEAVAQTSAVAAEQAAEKADGKIKLTLDEAKKIAIEKNPSLEITKARIQAAMAGIDVAMAGYYPTIDVNASAQRVRDAATRSSGTRDWKNQGRYSAGVSATWVLFDGFQREYNVLTAKYGLVDAQEADRDAQRLLLQQVSSAFYNTLLAQDEMNIAREDADFNRVLLDDAQKRHEGGIAKSSEVKNFELRVQNAEADYITAEKNWHVSLVALGSLLAISQDSIWEKMELVVPTSYKMEERGVTELYEYALQHRPDLLALNAKIENCRDAVTAAKDEWYPKVTAFGDYDYERYHSMHFNKHYDRNISYGVQMSWNVFKGGATSANINQTEATLVAALRQRDNLLISIDSEIRQSMLTIFSSAKMLKVQDANLATAKEIRDLVHEEYLGGTATITRLNETQTDVTNAASARSVAYMQLLNSLEVLRANTAENLAE